MYSIDGFCPHGVPLGAHAFTIYLAPEFKVAVAESGMTQAHVDRVLDFHGLEWLQKCGFSATFDPDNCGFDAKEPAVPGPEARPLYGHREIRVDWGAWGPEHISVPGNACGLDLERRGCTPGSPFENGAALLPHNIDSWGQKCLLTVVFTWFAHYVMCEANWNRRDKDN